MEEERKILGFRLILFLGYLAIGAAVFWYFENEKHLSERKATWTVINQIVRKYNISEIEKQTLISPYFETSITIYGRWNYGNSLVFAFTTVTTIGYGHMVPKTTGGRIFCILYSLIGIPLTCLILKSIGDQIAVLVSEAIVNFEKKCLRRVTPLKVKVKTTTATTALTLLVVLPVFAVTIKVRREEMTYLECFYFTFVSLSTIGFGDFVPHLQGDSEYLLLLFWFVGLSCVSSILCSLNLWFTKHGLGVQLSKAWESKMRWPNRKRVYTVSQSTPQQSTLNIVSQTSFEMKAFTHVNAATQTNFDNTK